MGHVCTWTAAVRHVKSFKCEDNSAHYNVLTLVVHVYEHNPVTHLFSLTACCTHTHTNTPVAHHTVSLIALLPPSGTRDDCSPHISTGSAEGKTTERKQLWNILSNIKWRIRWKLWEYYYINIMNIVRPQLQSLWHKEYDWYQQGSSLLINRSRVFFTFLKWTCSSCLI